MAKLNKDQQKLVKSAAGFDPAPDGVYHVRLRNVDPTKSGPAGPYWVWEFEIVEDVQFSGENGANQTTLNKRLWTNTSLSEAAAFKFKETFAAFGVPEDTDTDDLCGQIVRAVVTQRTIQSGPREGEMSNQIERLKPADPEFEVPEAAAAAAGSGPTPDDLF